VVALAALLPVGYLLVRAGEGGWSAVAETLFTARTGRLLARSLGLAAAVTLASALIGVALAWLTVRCDLPGRRGWRVVAALPLAVPSYVGAFAYVSVLPGLTGFRGAWLALTLLSYPYVFLPVSAALERVDPSFEEVSRSLGNNAAATFRLVTLPQLRPAIATGSLLVFLYTLSDFGAVSILRFDSFTRVIYQSYQSSFDRTPAAVLGCLLLAVTLVVVSAEARTRGRARYYSSGPGANRPPKVTRLGRARWWALLVPAGYGDLPQAKANQGAAHSSGRVAEVGAELDRGVELGGVSGKGELGSFQERGLADPVRCDDEGGSVVEGDRRRLVCPPVGEPQVTDHCSAIRSIRARMSSRS